MNPGRDSGTAWQLSEQQMLGFGDGGEVKLGSGQPLAEIIGGFLC